MFGSITLRFFFTCSKESSAINNITIHCIRSTTLSLLLLSCHVALSRLHHSVTFACHSLSRYFVTRVILLLSFMQLCYFFYSCHGLCHYVTLLLCYVLVLTISQCHYVMLQYHSNILLFSVNPFYSVSHVTLSVVSLYQSCHSVSRVTLSVVSLCQSCHSVSRVTLSVVSLCQSCHSVSRVTLSVVSLF